MTGIGHFNDLNVLAVSAKGARLDGGPLGELRLPAAELPVGCAPGSTLRVFLYLDAEQRPAATTATPAAQVGEVGFLKVVSTNDAGAFLAWGLPKDLLLPWNEVKREQKRLVAAGRKLLVAVFLAEDGRIAASSRLDEFLVDAAEGLREGDPVDILVAESTDLGLRVVVNHRFWGLVHQNEVFGTLARGHRQTGYVKALRPDGKLNIALSAPGYAKVDAVAQGILQVLARKGGFLAVSDQTPPEQIHQLFGISKRVFKQTIGALYRDRKIQIEPSGIRLVPPA